MMKRFPILGLALCLIGASASAATHTLVTDIESGHVDVTITFTGHKTLVYGALSQPGDVIIKVTSPKLSVDLLHKKPIGPFWLDNGKLTIRNTPGLYYLLSNRPLDKIATPAERQKFGLHLHDTLKNVEVNKATAAKMGHWQDEYLEMKQRDGLYQISPSAVKLVENRLFSATIELPANIPLGTYRLDIYLISNGKVISHRIQNLEVNQVHLERWLADAVSQHAWLFGAGFTAFALFLGLGFGMALRRGSDS